MTLDDLIQSSSVPTQKTGIAQQAVQDVRYGAGQNTAGVLEYVGSSPKAVNDLPMGIGNAVPNVVWGLGGMVQNAFGIGTPNTGMSGYYQSGVNRANEIGTKIAGQSVEDPKNFLDLVLREAALLAVPLKPKALEETAKHGATALESLSYLGKSILLPGMQAKSGAGMAAEALGQITVGDALVELFDDDTNIDNDPTKVPAYDGALDTITTAVSALSKDMFKPKPVTLDSLMLETPKTVTLDELIKLGDEDYKKADDEWDDTWSYAQQAGAVVGGILLAATGKATLSKYLGANRQQAILAQEEFAAHEIDVKQSATQKLQEVGKRIASVPQAARSEALNALDATMTTGGLRSSREADTMAEKVGDVLDSLNTQILDNYGYFRSDIAKQLRVGRIDTARALELNRNIDTIASNGTLSETIEASAKSRTLPLSDIRTNESLMGLTDRVAMMSPEEVAELGTRLQKRTALGRMNIHNAEMRATGKHDLQSNHWGNISKAELEQAVNAPASKNITSWENDWYDMTKKIVDWKVQLGDLDAGDAWFWKRGNYAPLRHAGSTKSTVGSTNFMKKSEMFSPSGSGGVMPENLVNPVNMIHEYFDATIRNTMKNKVNRDIMQMELDAGYKATDGTPMVRFATDADARKYPDQIVEINTFGKPLVDGNGKTRKGHVKVLLNDPVRATVLRDLPMMTQHMYSYLNALRQVAQQMTTGFAAPFFLGKSMMYETLSAFTLHPKGRNVGTLGQAYSKFTGHAWDVPDPSVLAAPIKGTIASLYSDALLTGIRRLNTYRKMRGNMTPTLLNQIAEGKVDGLARPLDHALLGALDDKALRAIHARMEKAYLNSGKFIKERYGGGTAANFGESWEDVIDMARNMSPAYTASLGKFDLRSSSGFKFLKALNNAAHGAVKVDFVNVNKSHSVRKATIAGKDVPVFGSAGMAGYLPEMHNMVADARKLTGNVLQRGGIRGTTIGEVWAFWRDTVPYTNVGMQVLSSVVKHAHKRPVQFASSVGVFTGGVAAYVMNEIIGNPAREEVYLNNMGPSARSSVLPIFDDEDNMVAGFDIAHEIRLALAPVIEGLLATMGKGNGAVISQDDGQSAAYEAMTTMWKTFFRDVNPLQPHPISNALSAAETGQRPPDASIGRHHHTSYRPSKNFGELENKDMMNRASMVFDELLMSGATMFNNTLRAVEAAMLRTSKYEDGKRVRGDDVSEVLDSRLYSDIVSGVTANFRKEANITSYLFDKPDRIERTVTSFDDPASRYWHDSSKKITEWVRVFNAHEVNGYGLAGQSSMKRDQMVRDGEGNLIRKGRMIESERILAQHIHAYMNNFPIDNVKIQMNGIMQQLENVDRQYSDPILKRLKINQLELDRKGIMLEGAILIKTLEEQLREKLPEQFTTFDELPMSPDVNSFEEEQGTTGKPRHTLPFLPN